MTIASSDLDRYLRAQQGVYDRVLAEIRAGAKRTHWMWFVFPQIAGLGSSAMSQRYAIRDIAEAQAYLEHPVLGARLTECADALLGVQGRSPRDIFGPTDDAKLRSCATLFACVSPPGSVFEQLLDRYYEGVPDKLTQQLLSRI